MAGAWRARIVSGGLLVLVGLVMFDVPAAYSIVRGAPEWLALAVGLAVFPVIPVAWHVWRERARRGALAEAAKGPTPKTPAKASKTTGWDRFAFRMLVAGVLVIGALIALDRTRVWRAVRHHALWMIPRTVEPLVPDSTLLDRVPATAEVVVWLRDTRDAHAMLSEIAPTSLGSHELVIAMAGSDVMVIERGNAGLIELIQPMYKLISRTPTAKLVELDGGVRMWSTSGWPAMPSRATALIDLMRRAPDTAFLVGAARPVMQKHAWDGVSGAVGWLGLQHGVLEAVGDVTGKTPLDTLRLVKEAETALAKARMAQPQSFACGSASGATIAFGTNGVVLRARATIALDQIRPMFQCLDKKP